MRRAILLIGLLTAACHVREMGGQTWDFDAEADFDEGRAYCDKLLRLGSQTTPQAALERAQLIIVGLPTEAAKVAECVRAAGPQALLEKGAQDAERASRELATDPQAWLVLAAYRVRLSGNPRTAADAACRASELAPGSADAAEACGVYLRDAGDAAGAVQAFKQAVLHSADRSQQFELIGLIERTSPSPKADLQSLPADLVEQFHAHQKERAAHAHASLPYGPLPSP
jgi:hypothetical protein